MPSQGLTGLVAQLVERRLCEAEALGSNPSESINEMHQGRSMLLWEGPIVSYHEGIYEAMYKLCIQTLTE